MNKKSKTISWVFQIIIIALIGMTLPAKFTSQPEAVKLFGELGMEPVGRFLTASLETVAIILLLVPASVAYGALLSAGLMSGAILAHVTKVGFADYPMGYLAIVVLICSLSLLFIRRTQLRIINRMFGSKA